MLCVLFKFWEHGWIKTMFPITWVMMEESLRSLWMRFKFNQEGRVLYRLLHFFHPTSTCISSAQPSLSHRIEIKLRRQARLPLPVKPPHVPPFKPLLKSPEQMVTRAGPFRERNYFYHRCAAARKDSVPKV